MKTLMLGLIALISTSAFAKDDCTKIYGHTVCFEVTTIGQNVVLTNITPDIQKKKSVAKELCGAAGDISAEYTVKYDTKKSCSYLGTRGFFGGGMVSSCLDFGGLTRGTVFSKIKCLKK